MLSSVDNLELLWTLIYSVLKPVPLTFLAITTSPMVNPLTFATLADKSLIPIVEPVTIVAFAICNCPPTAFTLSFSKVVVDNVPRIFAFSASINPFCSVDILTPFSPLTKSLDSIFESVIVNPPIVPPVAVILAAVTTPALVTLNTELAPNAIPSVPI